MKLFLTEQTAQVGGEPIVAAVALLVAGAIIFLAAKGKLRDWFLR